MPFISNAKAPQPIVKSFNINNFNGGLNNVKSPLTLFSNESPNLLNVMMFDDGVVEARPGTIKYFSQQILLETPKRMYHYKTASVDTLLVMTDHKIYKVSEGVSTLIASTTNLASGFQFNDKFYYIDGADFREYNGTNTYSIKQPGVLTGTAQAGGANTITLPSNASGVDDTYNNWYVHIVSGTGSGQILQIQDYVGGTKIATMVSPWGTQPDNTSVLYITQTPEGVVTIVGSYKMYSPTYLEYTSPYYGANIVGTVAACRTMCSHKNRIFFARHGTDKNTLYISRLDNFYYVPANEYRPVMTNDNDNIVGLYSFNDVMTIFKKNTIFALYGNDYEDYTFKEVTVECGAINEDVIRKMGNTLYYLGSDGRVYMLYDVRTDYKKILTKCISENINIHASPINLDIDDISDSIAITYGKYYILAIKDKILITNQMSDAWTMWDNLSPTAFGIHNNVLIFSNSTTYIFRLPFERYNITESFTAVDAQTEFNVTKGLIAEVSGTDQDAFVYINDVLQVNIIKSSNTKFITSPCTVGDTVRIEYFSLLPYNDNGVKYTTTYETKDYDFDLPNKVKQLGKIYLLAHTYKYYDATILFQTLVDYYEVDNGVAINNQIPLWGRAIFGVSRFIARNIVDSIPVQINRRGRIIRFRIYCDTINTPFKIFSINGDIQIRR